MLMMVSLVAADVNIKAGEEYTLTSITQCYGDVELNIRGVTPIAGGEYQFSGCTEQGANAWRCPCIEDGPTDVKLQTKTTTANTYDVALEYYIAPKLDETNPTNGSTPTQNALLNDNNRRTVAVGNIAVSSPQEAAPVDDIPQVNTEGTPSAMAFVALIALILIGGMILIGKWLYNSRENQIDEEKMDRGDALSFHNRSSQNNGGEKPRMSFFESDSSRHADNQIPIAEQSKPITTQVAPQILPPEQPKNVYRGPEPKKEITDKEINDFLENL